MAVYVDEADIPYRGMFMSHMWADTLDELLEMVDKIGVQRKWLQQPPKASWVHFDIARSKRLLAVKFGAIVTDRYGPMEGAARQMIKTGIPRLIDAGERRLASVRSVRAMHELEEMLR